MFKTGNKLKLISLMIGLSVSAGNSCSVSFTFALTSRKALSLSNPA